MSGLLIKFFNSFMWQGHSMCVSCIWLIWLTWLFPMLFLLRSRYVKWVNFATKKAVFDTCCKWPKKYNKKSLSQWAGVFFISLSLRSYNLHDDSLVGERDWVLLQQNLWFLIDSHFLFFVFVYEFINALCFFQPVYHLKI